MAQWNQNPDWLPIENINENKRLEGGDGVFAEDINKIVENLLYCYKNLSKANVEIGNVKVIESAVTSVNVVSREVGATTYLDFTFNIVKGKDGVGITSIFSGEPHQDTAGEYTITTIGVLKTDGTRNYFDVRAKNGEDGASNFDPESLDHYFVRQQVEQTSTGYMSQIQNRGNEIKLYSELYDSNKGEMEASSYLRITPQGVEYKKDNEPFKKILVEGDSNPIYHYTAYLTGHTNDGIVRKYAINFIYNEYVDIKSVEDIYFMFVNKFVISDVEFASSGLFGYVGQSDLQLLYISFMEDDVSGNIDVYLSNGFGGAYFQVSNLTINYYVINDKRRG